MNNDETPKRMALRLIADMPDDSTAEELIEELDLNFTLIRSNRQIALGQFITHEETCRKSKQWVEKLSGASKPSPTLPQPTLA